MSTPSLRHLYVLVVEKRQDLFVLVVEKMEDLFFLLLRDGGGEEGVMPSRMNE